MAKAYKCDNCGGVYEGKPANQVNKVTQVEEFGIFVSIGKAKPQNEQSSPLGSLWGLPVFEEEDDTRNFDVTDLCTRCTTHLVKTAMELYFKEPVI